MTLEKRRSPYMWITAITGLLSGEDHCEWAAWLRSNYTFEKRIDGGGDALSRWMSKHDDLVAQRVVELKRDGWRVEVEDQNRFTVRGKATVGGKPDIVAFQGDEVLISDPKGGKRKHKYIWQVRAYMVLLPLKDKRLRGKTIRGEVVYPDGIEPVTVDADDAGRIFAQITASGPGPEPNVTPSESECRYCPVSECADRFEGSTEAAGAGGRF